MSSYAQMLCLFLYKAVYLRGLKLHNCRFALIGLISASYAQEGSKDSGRETSDTIRSHSMVNLVEEVDLTGEHTSGMSHGSKTVGILHNVGRALTMMS